MNEIELSVLDFIKDHISSAAGDVVIPIITALGSGGILWIALTLVMLCIPKMRKYGLVVLVSLVLEAVACNLVLKPWVARSRPFDVNTAVELLVKRPRDYSFPSGHTGASFAVAAALYFSRHKSWIPVTILAILIGFSRLYLYVHYPTDVLVGALLGILSGWIAAKIIWKDELKSKTNQKIESDE